MTDISSTLTALVNQSGLGLAIAGGMIGVMGGCIGSAKGIRIAASQAAGVMSEKPELFGSMLVLIALPGTQGFYSFIGAVFIALKVGLIAKTVVIPPAVGFALFFVGAAQGGVEWHSAISQGETSAAAINLVARRPDQAGRAILLPAMVETYAVLSLLATILMTLWLCNHAVTVTNPLAPGA